MISSYLEIYDIPKLFNMELFITLFSDANCMFGFIYMHIINIKLRCSKIFCMYYLKYKMSPIIYINWNKNVQAGTSL